jgi:hypothetical protein
MADHSKPVLTSAYADFVTELDARFDDLAVGIDPAVTTATNVPTNAIRWSSAASKWQKYNGSTWADLTALYAINISGNAATATNGVVTSGSYADPAWITSLAGSKVAGNIAGNAATATTLATARTINGVSFNGSANISVNLSNNLTFNNGGSGAASGVNFSGGTATTISYNTIGAPSATGAGASGTWGINVTGNAATATNGVVTTGSYADPAWITSLSGDKLVGGAAKRGVFYENANVLTQDYTISTGYNAMSAGPITINSGVTATVPSGSAWAVV